MAKLRVVFMGTPEFALPTLDALIAADVELAAVYTQPPRPADRGQRERPGPVHVAADRNGLAVMTPRSLKPAADQDAFRAHQADVAVVVAYGLILPSGVLSAPRLGCLNLHPSLLPRWRGAAPIQRALMAGDAETGVTIMQLDEGLDSGPILLQESTPIGPDDTAGSLHDKLAEMGASMMVTALAERAAGRLTPKPQPDDGVTYADKIDRAEQKLDWYAPAESLARKVRALSPRPGAYFEIGGDRWKVLAADFSDDQGAPGVVLDDRLTVACGSGALRPTLVQRPGKRALPVAEVLRGAPITAGAKLD